MERVEAVGTGRRIEALLGPGVATVALAVLVAWTTWPAPAASPGGAPASAAAASWDRRLANALVVPLLDPEGELAWAEPSAAHPCRDSADVRLDGAAPEPGRRLPVDVPVRLTLQLRDCWPLGLDGIRLDGALEIELRAHADRIDVTLRPQQLSGIVDGRQVPFTETVDARIELASGVRP